MRLRAAGYETSSAFDGEAGMKAVVANHPDAIVLDMRMPKKNGLEMLDELKQNIGTRNIPVVMLSASIGDQQAALDGGARFFVKKPFLGTALVAAVDAAICDSQDHEWDNR